MRTYIYPGTFDPPTNGHMDVARRAARLCDRLIIAVLPNRNKKTVFSVDERVEMVRKSLPDLPEVEVTCFQGLLADFYRQVDASAVVRGSRSESDFRLEAEMAVANRLLNTRFETIFLLSRIELSFTSSSIVREVASYGGDISGMVPAEISTEILERLSTGDKQS